MGSVIALLTTVIRDPHVGHPILPLPLPPSSSSAALSHGSARSYGRSALASSWAVAGAPPLRRAPPAPPSRRDRPPPARYPLHPSRRVRPPPAALCLRRSSTPSANPCHAELRRRSARAAPPRRDSPGPALRLRVVLRAGPSSAPARAQPPRHAPRRSELRLRHHALLPA